MRKNKDEKREKKDENDTLRGSDTFKKIVFYGINLKCKKITHLPNFLIASSQIFKNDVILINHGSFFQEKDSLQFERCQFFKKNKL